MLIIQRSQIAGFPFAGPCVRSGKVIHSLLRRARRGSRTKQHRRSYETARKGRSGKSTGAVDETATDSANFFGPPYSGAPPVTTRLRSPRCRLLAPASAEHRPGRHRAPVGGRARDVHLFRPARRRSERRHGDRACAGFLRRDLAPGAPARRRHARAPASPAHLTHRTYAARRTGRRLASAKTSLRASSLPSCSWSRSRRVGVGVEALQVRHEQARTAVGQWLRQDVHSSRTIGDLPL